MGKRIQTPKQTRESTKIQVTYRFGFQISDIHAAARLIRPLLRIRWKAHHEAFWGGDYYLQMRKNGMIIKLHHNYEEYFDHWLQPSFKDYPVLLLMQYPPGSKPPSADELLEIFEGVGAAVLIPSNSDAFQQLDV